MSFLEKGEEDFVISLALLQKAVALTNERKIEEIKILAELIGIEVGKTIARVF